MFTVLLKWDPEITEQIDIHDNVVLIFDDYDFRNYQLDLTKFVDHYQVSDFNNLTEIVTLSIHIKGKYGSFIQVLSHTEFTQYAQSYMLAYFFGNFKFISERIIFRNKFLMKNHARKFNIKTTNYALAMRGDLTSIKQLTLPIIIKPINGMGAENTVLCNTVDDVRSVMKDKYRLMLAEEYVVGDEFHADALIEDNKVIALSISQYLTSPINAFISFIDISILKNYNGSKELYEKVAWIINSFLSESSYKATLVHFEFFINKENDIIFSELATRMGGGYIKLMIRNVFKMINFKKDFIHFSLKGKSNIIEPIFANPEYYYAGVNIRPATSGVVKNLPTDSFIKSLKGVIDYDIVSKLNHPIGRWGIMLCIKSDSISSLKNSIYSAQKRITRNYKCNSPESL